MTKQISMKVGRLAMESQKRIRSIIVCNNKKFVL